MMQRHFDDELRDLKENLVCMGNVVEDMFQKAMDSLLEREEKLAQEVIDRDDEVDRLEVKIENMSIELIVLRQPVASDLRKIITALHINRQLERMGDKAANIAERSIKLLGYPPVKPYVDLPRAFEIVRSMVSDTLDAYMKCDIKLAIDVIERDGKVDELRDQIFRELLTYMLEDSKYIRPALEIILVSRHIERIGDLATDISEEIIYTVQGEIVKHQFD
ncbi:phosphate signaling complex protein PhoU [Candidatus Poribacteria bacterium]|nr:phosphate signaling complex protein PhoU [Candidatus Poribacteria bacterium]